MRTLNECVVPHPQTISSLVLSYFSDVCLGLSELPERPSQAWSHGLLVYP